MQSVRVVKTIIIGCCTSFLWGCTPTEEIITQSAEPLRIVDPFSGKQIQTVLFDTVLTERNTITKRIQLINPSAQAQKIQKISLSGGSASAFQLWINGVSTSEIHNVFLRGNDSLYLFVQARLPTSSVESPFLVVDSIIILSGNNRQIIYLHAWGRNAKYYRGDTLYGNVVWDRTYARFIYQTIYIAPGAVLEIGKGTLIYAAHNAGIKVAGTLSAKGDTGAANQIKFTGSRTDKFWAATPGMWQGIEFLNTSKQNYMEHVVLTNAKNGITIGNSTDATEAPELVLGNSTLMYHSQHGVWAQHANLTMWNCVISNCAGYYVGASGGGNYTLIHNTLVERFSNAIVRTKPAFYISNRDAAHQSEKPTQITFINNVVWGERQKECVFENEMAYSLKNITHNFFRDSTTRADNTVFVFNRNSFVNPRVYQKHLDTLHLDQFFRPTAQSPLRGRGVLIPTFNFDKRGVLRADTVDIGAFQYQK